MVIHWSCEGKVFWVRGEGWGVRGEGWGVRGDSAPTELKDFWDCAFYKHGAPRELFVGWVAFPTNMPLLWSSKISDAVFPTNITLRRSFLWVGRCFLQTCRSEGAFCGLVGVSTSMVLRRSFLCWSLLFYRRSASMKLKNIFLFLTYNDVMTATLA